MYDFDEFLEKHVIITIGAREFEGILIEHNYRNEESLKSWAILPIVCFQRLTE